MNSQRKKAEDLIYRVFQKLDPSGAHVNYYKKKFAAMNDAQFKTFISRKFPYRFQPRLFTIEPTMIEINAAANEIGFPIMEEVRLPYMAKNKEGIPIKTKEALVVYVPLKKMKQFITKKNSMSVDIDMRDQKTGLLISDDKNGKTSDREFEALTVMGLTQTVRELSRPRADSMKSKSVMYNTINTVGKVNLTELPDEPDDVLSKNMLNVYLIGSGLDSNLLNTDGYLPITLKDKQRSVIRK